MTTNYQPGIPTGTVPLNQDYRNIQKNFKQLNDTYLIDHIAYDVLSNNGFHTVIHQVTQGGDPPNSTANQIYSKLVAGDSALFMKSINGVVQQLSGAFTASGNGSVTLPGGIVLKWGLVTGLSGGPPYTNLVTFATPFPANCFAVVTTPQITTGPAPNGSASIAIVKSGASPVNTGFIYDFNSNFGSDSTWKGFYWVAIGN